MVKNVGKYIENADVVQKYKPSGPRATTKIHLGQKGKFVNFYRQFSVEPARIVTYVASL